MTIFAHTPAIAPNSLVCIVFGSTSGYTHDKGGVPISMTHRPSYRER